MKCTASKWVLPSAFAFQKWTSRLLFMHNYQGNNLLFKEHYIWTECNVFGQLIACYLQIKENVLYIY